MQHQPVPAPPPYSAHQPTPIGWAIDHIPNENSTGNDNDHSQTNIYTSMSFSFYNFSSVFCFSGGE
jgi:hypothetical protein